MKQTLCKLALAGALLCAAAAPAAAQEVAQQPLSAAETSTALENLPDSRDLFADYVQRLFTVNPIAPLANYGEIYLQTDFDRTLYHKLRDKIAQVADGTLSSTTFTFTLEELGITQQQIWTAEDLGVDQLMVEDGSGRVSVTEEGWQAIYRKMGYSGLTNLMECLRVDCPYDLYWYDKTSTGRTSSEGPGISYYLGDLSRVILSPSATITIHLGVSADYAPGGAVGGQIVDTAKTGAASAAAQKAQQIVADNAALGDRDKLEAYKTSICDLTSYNDAAADDPTTLYGDPWQLIYVFDGNPATTVVCEGYAKSFQYLCDLSSFAQDLVCYTVTGDMDGEGHMWNLVRTPEATYMVDVTNSDQGSIGQNGGLFMTAEPASGDWENGYYFAPVGTGRQILYQYDQDTMDLYGADLLTVELRPAVTPEPTPTVTPEPTPTVTPEPTPTATPEPTPTVTPEPTPTPTPETSITSEVYPIEDGNLLLKTPVDAQTLLAGVTGKDITLTAADGTPLTGEDPVGTGALLSQAGGEPELVVVFYGDLTGDGAINISDLVEMRRAVLEMITLEGPQLRAATPLEDPQPGISELVQLRRVVLEMAEDMLDNL